RGFGTKNRRNFRKSNENFRNLRESHENFEDARFFDEKLAQFKGRWERLPRPESREPLSGGGCRHFAVFRQKTRIPDGVGVPERGNSAKYAVLIRKNGLLLKGFAKNRLV